MRIRSWISIREGRADKGKPHDTNDETERIRNGSVNEASNEEDDEDMNIEKHKLRLSMRTCVPVQESASG